MRRAHTAARTSTGSNQRDFEGLCGRLQASKKNCMDLPYGTAPQDVTVLRKIYDFSVGYKS